MSQANPYLPPEASLEGERIDDDEELASRGRRLGAAMIDGVIISALVWGAIFAFGQYRNVMSGATSIGLRSGFAVMGFAIYILLHGYFLKTNGQTIGKKILGIKVVDLNGKRPAFSKLVFVRHLPFSLLGAIPFAGPLLAMVNPLFIFRGDRRCAHDLLAGTRVVRIRKAA